MTLLAEARLCGGVYGCRPADDLIITACRPTGRGLKTLPEENVVVNFHPIQISNQMQAEIPNTGGEACSSITTYLQPFKMGKVQNCVIFCRFIFN